MAAPRLSPTARLLRNSRLFALPQALTPPQDPPTSKTVAYSDTATLPHPIRASIVTPASSLARGDWGLKRPLPSKTTSDTSSRPVVRVKELDTFEHVTDFESAADHTMTLEKFQQLHMPMSLPEKVLYAGGQVPRHRSPFESHVDNTETSKGLEAPGAQQFRHSGPWLVGQTEAQFEAYLKKVRGRKPELLQQLRERWIAKRSAEQRKRAQDNGEDLETLEPVTVSEEDFQAYIKSLRADPSALGHVIFELLDLPSPPAVPAARMSHKNYAPPATKLSATVYAVTGPPKTHPSAGLSYTRSHALLYNHPQYGPQTRQRPVEARILRPKGRFKGKTSKAVAGVAGITVEDLNAQTFPDGHPPGLVHFDANIPGGAKYWVTPIRASVTSDGRINLASYNATPASKAAHGIDGYGQSGGTSISDVARGDSRVVPRLDKLSPRQPRFTILRTSAEAGQPMQGTEDITRSLMKSLSSS